MERSERGVASDLKEKHGERQSGLCGLLCPQEELRCCLRRLHNRLPDNLEDRSIRHWKGYVAWSEKLEGSTVSSLYVWVRGRELHLRLRWSRSKLWKIKLNRESSDQLVTDAIAERNGRVGTSGWCVAKRAIVWHWMPANFSKWGAALRRAKHRC